MHFWQGFWNSIVWSVQVSSATRFIRKTVIHYCVSISCLHRTQLSRSRFAFQGQSQFKFADLPSPPRTEAPIVAAKAKPVPLGAWQQQFSDGKWHSFGKEGCCADWLGS